MARKYLIRAGCAFTLGGGLVATGGEEIELEDDVAATHADKLEPLPDAESTTAAPVQTPASDDAGQSS
jgi:hypothetical protein